MHVRVALGRSLLVSLGVDLGWLQLKASEVATHSDVSRHYQEHLAMLHLRTFDALVMRQIYKGTYLALRRLSPALRLPQADGASPSVSP